MDEVRRPDDGELCGHVELRDDAWCALVVFGAVLGRHPTREEAEAHVLSDGLPALADRWTLRRGDGSSEAVVCIQEVSEGSITEATALERRERFTEIKMRLLSDRVSRRTAWKIASQQGWDSTFEAEYLAVCKLQADALVTIDPALAAMAGDIVPLAPLAALSSR